MTTLASQAAVPAVHRPRRVLLDRSIAACFALAVLLHVGPGARGLLLAGVVAVLVELAAIDLELRIIPNRIVLPGLFAVLCAQLALGPDRYLESLVWAAAAGGFMLVPSLVRRGAVGMGDVKLAALLGAALGQSVAPALAISLVAAGGAALLVLATQSRAALRRELPLGPFLAGGAIVTLLFSAPGLLA